MRYVVRVVAWRPERLANVEKMREQIPHLEVVTDHVGAGYATLFEACSAINETGGVLLEDDVQLCRDFTQRVNSALVGKESTVVNFFERPKIALDTRLVGGSQFMWTQCVYMPPGFPAKCMGYHDEFKAARPAQWSGMGYDLLIAYALVKERMKYWRIRPTLVQHLPFASAIGHRPNNRQTPYFIDDLEADAHALHLPK